MKSYLGLVNEYARVHKKKQRLTVVCIALSVMLVTAIFGMAEMSIKAQINAYIRMEGNYHAVINGISDDIAGQIAGRSDVSVSGWVGVEGNTSYQGKTLMLQGGGEEITEEMNLTVLEGRYPASEQEALIDQQALRQFGIAIGDTIEVPLADGSARTFKITGVYGEFSMLSAEDAHGLFLTAEGIRAIGSEQFTEKYYVQFKQGVNIRKALAQMQAEYGLQEAQVTENIRLLGLMGQSGESAITQLYLTAGVLSVLVTMAGVFMIAGSFNMSVIERTQFFGLLRCLGASKRQIRRYIRLEGLRYSLTGIPLGLLAGCLIIWGAVFALNMLDLRSVMPKMPLFQMSWLGMGAGGLIGFLVVMLASGTPAKKAAQVSPQAAVSGNMNQTSHGKINRAANTKLHVDTSMGIHHALSNKKNLMLTAGSFALSIILLLSFTVLIVFMKHAINPLEPYAADLSVTAADGEQTIDKELAVKLRALPHIKELYGRMFAYDIPASLDGQSGTVTLVSYDEPQFKWAEEMLVGGSMKEAESGNGVLVCYKKGEEGRLKTGGAIALELGGTSYDLPISGILSDMPFQPEGTEWLVICSEPVFTELTGISGYTIVDMQVEEDIAEQVRGILPPELTLKDMQQRNEESRTAYYTMAVFVYGFVFVIAFVAFINIINTVNASISSRMGHYGVMRAVGMSGRQLSKVIFAEAVTYAATGCAVGCILGLTLHRFFYDQLITVTWGNTWEPPVNVLLIMVAACIATTGIAAAAPSGKIRCMSIVSVVNAQ